ncbi:hypothetical protein GV794_28610 [Nocardia cyriacigeorgica]|uniref:Uncharacterized protein n=1 Tax=Nocardia cyriacigeorgica TaxID=135487 RepID=A0A6P1D1L1_9NOCA|nr:hypothetical protein [Nocardia cyriacigeorgica]NEW40179.1 hypothetical protein [Nocardia cyriacigeorgica]NEW43434.1 hypothetical protein [Nocardia cyriacigeorgica]NEW51495.1 hypothetical protein [Nocardia cyriacigeorgica]NEW59556.1 hypothetical protein [Nocardia cyriacigeorgica]
MVLDHNSPEMRKQANAERAAAEPAYARSEGDPDWERDFEEMFGKAANRARGQWMRRIHDRKVNYTGIGDDRNTAGDYSDISAAKFDDTDIDGAGNVRRSGPKK